MDNNINLTFTINIEIGESTKNFLSTLLGGGVQTRQPAPKPVQAAERRVATPAVESKPTAPTATEHKPAESVPETQSLSEERINDKQKKAIKSLWKDLINEYRDEIIKLVADNSTTLAAGEKPSINTIAASKFDAVCEALKQLED